MTPAPAPRSCGAAQPVGGPVTTNAEQRGPVTAAWLLSLVVCLAVAMGAGCGASNPHPVGTFERAAYWQEKGHFQDAAQAYEVFVRQNPTDSLAAEAQFQKALSYMFIEEYPLAAVEFQILAQDYPVSPLVEAARFHEGECYYFQVGRIERDVTPAYEARLHWLDFARQYPNSEYLPQVRQYMQEITDLLVEKRLRAVKVYRQLGRWEAVAIGLDRTLEEEPSSTLTDRVLYLRGQAAEKLDDRVRAEQVYRRIVDEFPDSEYRDRAQDALRKLARADDEES
jgi:outer membrane protein assembly factor BamD